MGDPINLSTTAFSYADFTPADGQPLDQTTLSQIKGGDIGKIKDVSFSTGAMVVTTDKGTFTFHGPSDKDLPPGDGSSLKDAGGTSGRVGEYDMSGVTTIYDIMTLLHKLSAEQKKGAREGKMAATEMQNQKLLEAADDIRKGAIIALVTGVVSGAISIGAAAMSGIGAAKGLSALKGAKSELNVMTDSLKNTKDVSKGITIGSERTVASNSKNFDAAKASLADKSAYATNIGALWGARGQGMNGIGQIINSAGQFGNSMYQAAQKEDEADAQMMAAMGEREGDFVQAMKDAQAKIMEVLGAIESANNESTKAILRA